MGGRGGRVERRSSLYRLLGRRTRRDGRLAPVVHVGGGRTRLFLSEKQARVRRRHGRLRFVQTGRPGPDVRDARFRDEAAATGWAMDATRCSGVGRAVLGELVVRLLAGTRVRPRTLADGVLAASDLVAADESVDAVGGHAILLTGAASDGLAALVARVDRVVARPGVELVVAGAAGECVVAAGCRR